MVLAVCEGVRSSITSLTLTRNKGQKGTELTIFLLFGYPVGD